MSKLKFSRQFLKCLYLNKLRYEKENLIDISLSEFIEESLMSYLNINLIDIDSEKITIDLDIFGSELLTDESENMSGDIKNDIIFDKYVYVYMDPRKKLKDKIVINISGDIFEFDYHPFYIGKGSGDRMFHHLKMENSDINFDKRDIIEEIFKSGEEPIIRMVKGSLINTEAFTLENILISKMDKLSNLIGKSKNTEYLITDKKETIEYNKINHLINILNSTNSNIEASERLGLSERTIYRMKNRLNIKKVNNVWCQV